jgi:urease accessory protein
VPRAVKLLAPGAAATPAIDTLILLSADRRNPRASVVGGNGTRVEFDFADAIALRTDDCLLLDSGDVVEVVAAPEPLFEVRADLATLARIAWALGDRHVPVEFFPARLRLHRDDTLAALITALGGKIANIDAPFEPEGGAYAAGAAHMHAHHDHDHGHHGHDHAHHHHGKADHEH